jgi:hypothetical protein
MTTTVIKKGQGVLHSITLNTPVATGLIEVYDGTDAEYPLIASILTPAIYVPFTLVFDIASENGLTVVTSVVAQDITVSYS